MARRNGWPDVTASRGKTHAAREGETHQAPRAQEAARLWLLPSGPDQVHAAPLLGTRRTPPSRAAWRMAERGGFEPPAGFWPALAFQASSLSRSVTPPHGTPLAHHEWCLGRNGDEHGSGGLAMRQWCSERVRELLCCLGRSGPGNLPHRRQGSRTRRLARWSRLSRRGVPLASFFVCFAGVVEPAVVAISGQANAAVGTHAMAHHPLAWPRSCGPRSPRARRILSL